MKFFFVGAMKSTKADGKDRQSDGQKAIGKTFTGQGEQGGDHQLKPLPLY